MFSNNSTEIKAFPLPVYFIFLLILTLCGILVSSYLSVSHYRVYTDIDYSSFCAVSKSINCDTVSQSPYSIFLHLPVPIWGLLGYVFLLITLFFPFEMGSKKINNLPTLFFLGIVFSVISIFLAIISTVKIHSYCLMCIVTYGINFMFLYMVWLMIRRFENKKWKAAIADNILFWKSHKTKALKFYSPIIIFTFVIIFFIPDYWNIGPGDLENKYWKLD